jgi:probable rRNA maturation factor
MMADDPDQPVVLVSNRQTAPVDEPDLVALARSTLRGEGVERAELSVSFVDENEMADLHLRYVGEEGPTDVLSFPLDGDDGDGDERVLGDVVIAPAVAARNRPDAAESEVRLLLVHGILHLLGYDHEADDERARMWARQERYSGVRMP